METQVTKRPECRGKEGQKAGNANKRQTLKQGAVKVLKLCLGRLLLRPETWRFLEVNLPAIGEKAELIMKQVASWFDHF